MIALRSCRNVHLHTEEFPLPAGPCWSLLLSETLSVPRRHRRGSNINNLVLFGPREMGQISVDSGDSLHTLFRGSTGER